MTELANGLACKGKCESRVNMVNQMLDSNLKIMSATRHQVRSSGLLSLLMGIGCSVFAVLAHYEIGGFLPYFIGLLAIFTLSTGVLRLSRKQQYPQIEGKKD